MTLNYSYEELLQKYEIALKAIELHKQIDKNNDEIIAHLKEQVAAKNNIIDIQDKIIATQKEALKVADSIKEKIMEVSATG